MRGPDVSYWSKERLTEVPVGYVEAAPDLVVEVLSPSNTSKWLSEKGSDPLSSRVHLLQTVEKTEESTGGQTPFRTATKIRTKLEEYFTKGVRMVWVVSPEDRTVTVYRTRDEGRLLHESAMLSGEDVLAGFSCRVSDLLP